VSRLAAFGGLSFKIEQEKGDQEDGITRGKIRAGGTALRAVERDIDPEKQAPLAHEVFVFLDQCLTPSPAA
jgi:hypothetical protein